MPAGKIVGTFAGVGQSDAFEVNSRPCLPRAFNVTLSGVFVASVRVKRSFDQGVTWHPLTAAGSPLFVFSGPVSEGLEESEPGVLYCLECTTHSSGVVNYRISQ